MSWRTLPLLRAALALGLLASCVRHPPPILGPEAETPVDYGIFPPGSTGRILCQEVPAYRPENRHDNLARFVQRQLRLPTDTAAARLRGRVFVTFIVGATGQVRDVHVMRGLHPLLDAEAVRAVQLLDGRMKPAVCGGRYRAHPFTLAVPFGAGN